MTIQSTNPATSATASPAPSGAKPAQAHAHTCSAKPSADHISQSAAAKPLSSLDDFAAKLPHGGLLSSIPGGVQNAAAEFAKNPAMSAVTHAVGNAAAKLPAT